MLTSCHGGLRLERTMEEFSPASHQLAVKKSLVLTGAAIMVFPPLQTRKCHNLKISDHTRYNHTVGILAAITRKYLLRKRFSARTRSDHGAVYRNPSHALEARASTSRGT